MHPARQEPLGRVLLEAAAAGVAVVATDVGGTPEIFPPDSESARLVPPDDAAALAAAMLELLDDEALRAGCRLPPAAARKRISTFAKLWSNSSLTTRRCFTGATLDGIIILGQGPPAELNRMGVGDTP